MGHGSGSAYCSIESMLEGPSIRAISFLLGCSSVRLGTFDPANSAKKEVREDKRENSEGSKSLMKEENLKGFENAERYTDSKCVSKSNHSIDQKALTVSLDSQSSSNPNQLSLTLSIPSLRLTRIDTVLYYLLQQAPIVVGCLWDVSDGDLDRITHRLVTHLIETNKEHDLSQLTALARTASLLRSLVGASVVVYGLPTSCRMP